MFKMRPYETYGDYAARWRAFQFRQREEEAHERVSRFLDEYERSERPEMIRRIIERAEQRTSPHPARCGRRGGCRRRGVSSGCEIGGREMETETRLIVERIEHGIQSEIRTTIPVEQFAGAETVTMGTPGFETTYRILSAETVPVQQPESPADVLDRVTAAFWEEIKSILGAGNVKVQGWDDLLPENRNNIRSALRDAADELSDA